jgi:ABC-type sugar transport system ATPase subunit
MRLGAGRSRGASSPTTPAATLEVSMADGIARPILELRDIVKCYPGVRALRGANFFVVTGEVHALLGGNGAGKSTMVGIIAGTVLPDAGDIQIAGERVTLTGPRDAIARGVSVIYQELMQVPDLSVAENIVLGRVPTTKLGRVDWRRTREIAVGAMADLGLQIDPDARLGSLPTGVRQQVEIARAITAKPSILVMDEPTSALSEQEVEHLFLLLRRLKSQGLTIIYITHHLDEIFALADRLTVFRDGRDVLSTSAKAITTRALAEAIVGRSLETSRRRMRPETGAPRLVLEGLSTQSIADIDLTVRAGEIVGLAGTLGSGRTELLRAVAGVDRTTSGSIRLDGSEVTFASPADAIRAGVVLVPEDRKTDGLILDMSVADNITLPTLDRLSYWGFVPAPRQVEVVDRMIKRLGIRTPSWSQPVRKLSGGNQQKTVLARWVSMEPRVLLLDQPLRGLDVLAKEEVYQRIDELAETGVAILFAATEIIEILNCCHRAVVLREGRIIEALDNLAGLSEPDLAHLVMRDTAESVPVVETAGAA